MSDLAAAYSGSAATWAAGPSALYRRMADAMVQALSDRVAGARVLDAGAGSGATSAAWRAGGAACVVGVDRSADMLALGSGPRAAADVLALPVRPGSFDIAGAAFVLSHLDEPARALRELARAVRPGGVVTTLGYDTRWNHPARAAVEAGLRAHGYARPDWYEHMKTVSEPRTGTPDALAATARGAGLVDVEIVETTADTGIRDADGLIAWRLGLPMYAPFVAGLHDAARDALLDELRGALGRDPEPLIPGLLVLVAGPATG